MARSHSIQFMRPIDALVVFFAFFLSVLNIIYVPFPDSLLLVLANGLAAAIIIFLATGRTKHNVFTWMHDWYVVPIIFLTFKEVYVIIQAMSRPDLDLYLIAIDHWMFGVNPTVYLFRFATPLLTEILQIAYTSFYVIMLVLGIELYIKKETKKFTFSIFSIAYGFYLSYLGYLLFPGVGPRFTLHDFTALSAELPGLWLTEPLRNIINAGESIPRGSMNAYALAQRDVFPSGHTEMTLIVLYYATKYKLKSRYVLYILGALLIIGTVYLRYHYVIDVIFGAVFMVITVWTAPMLVRWWDNVIAKKSFLPPSQGEN